MSVAKSKWLSVFKYSYDNIFIIDRNGHILEMNYVPYGYSPEELSDMNYFDLIDKSQRELIKSELDQVFLIGRPIMFEFKNFSPDTSIRWYSCVAAPIRKENRVESLVIINRDATDQRNAAANNMLAMIEGQENERKRVGQELHDSLGQILSGLSLGLASLEVELSSEDLAAAAANLNRIKLMAAQAIGELRNISHNLLPGTLELDGLIPALEELCARTQLSAEIDISFQSVNAAFRLNRSIEVNLYRIAQELIHNCIKHSFATKFNLQIVFHEYTVVLIAEDDGVGFDPSSTSSGLGLKNIYSRTKMLGGELLVESSPQSGTLISVEVPILS